MRIVTRADFDSIVCAVLLYEVLDITEEINWVEPHEMRYSDCGIKKGDIVANLPFNKNCSMWFDHHISNKAEIPFEGKLEMAPSAAGVIYNYYKGKFNKNFDELIKETDKIDSADLSVEEILTPEKFPYLLLSMTIKSRLKEDVSYWKKLIELLRMQNIKQVIEDSEVKKRCLEVVEENKKYEKYLKEYTVEKGFATITDFRSLKTMPSGNRFLVHSLYPNSYSNIKIRYSDDNTDKVIVSSSHSIFNNHSKVNIGLLATKYGGGGHYGAGAASTTRENANALIKEISTMLSKNIKNSEEKA